MDSLLKFCICDAENAGKKNIRFSSQIPKNSKYDPKWEILKFSNS